MQRPSIFLVLLLSLSLGSMGCSDDTDRIAADSGVDASSPEDAGSTDATVTPDAGSEDAGSEDAGSEDAGSEDAGSEDAGSEDAGSEDAGSEDAGSEDAGSEDAGSDEDAGGGLMSCAIATIPNGGTIPAMTLGSGDDISPDRPCVSPTITGPDRIYAVVAGAAGTYRVRGMPINPDFDLMLYAYPDCTFGTCLDAANLNGPGGQESIELDLDAGEAAYVVVDTDPLSPGANSEGGALTLSVEVL